MPPPPPAFNLPTRDYEEDDTSQLPPPPPDLDDLYQIPPNNSLADLPPPPPELDSPTSPMGGAMPPPPPPPELSGPAKVVAIFNYTKLRDDELELLEGDVITIIKENDDGWIEGVKDGIQGLFPGNYVTPYM